jgi:hypothetical protein
VNEAPTATAATHCNVQLVKSLTFPDPMNSSAMQQAKNGLSFLTSGTNPACTDADLVALGHLPEGTFGDRWQRWVMIARLGGALNELAQLAADTTAAFKAMNAAGGCPLCARVATPPCFQQSCALAAGTTATAHAPASFSIALVGEIPLDVCRDDTVLPNEFVLVGRPAKTLNRALVFSTNVCIRLTGAEGYVACAGSTAPKVSYVACQDHLVNAPDVDECAGVGVSCGASRSDPIPEHAGAENGGPCFDFNPASPAAGAGLALATIEMTLIDSAQRGADGIACTDDDLAPEPLVLTVPLTTATAQGFVFDAVASPGNGIAPAATTGIGFGCTAISSGSLTGGKLVGAGTTLHGFCLGAACDDPATVPDEGAVPIDTVTMFSLACQ